jgi:hypothetical protein
MVKKIFPFIVSVLFLSLVCAPAFCEQRRMITLKDGTSVLGEILSYENNVYTVRSSLGQLQIKDEDIVKISTPGLEPSAAPASPQDNLGARPVDSDIAQAQQQLMADGNFMAQAKAITEDPQIMKALSQPDIMQAVINRDVKALEANPTFKNLLNNPKILDLMRSAEEKMGQSAPSP